MAETRGGEAHGGCWPGLTGDGPGQLHASLQHRSSICAVRFYFMALSLGRGTLTFPDFSKEGKMCPLALLVPRPPQIKPLPSACAPCRAWSVNALTRC